MLLRKIGAEAASPTNAVSVATSYCTWYMATLLSLYVFACLALYIYQCHHRYMASNTHYPIAMYDQLSTDVYLKFWTGLRLAVLNIDHILAPQDTLEVDRLPVINPSHPTKWKPFVLANPKNAWFTMKVNLDWCTTTLTHKPSKLVIPLPPTPLGPYI